MLLDYLSRDPALELTATVRSQALVARYQEAYPEVRWRLFDADALDLWDELRVLDGHDWIISAIGFTKTLISGSDGSAMENAIRTNSLLPYAVGRRAQAAGAKVLQIATDCVYSGSKGRYLESDNHDAYDAYGMTKSLGEGAPNISHLRCSFIGPEPRARHLLLEWFLGQPRDSSVNGYVNHRWNGVTTLHGAILCRAVITHNLDVSSLQHVVPDGIVTKYELLNHFAHEFHREDISITPFDTPVGIDRTLATKDDSLNRELWESAGYPVPPSIPEMVRELAQYDYRFPRTVSEHTAAEVNR